MGSRTVPAPDHHLGPHRTPGGGGHAQATWTLLAATHEGGPGWLSFPALGVDLVPGAFLF